MASGIEVYDPNTGALIMDNTTFIGRVVGEIWANSTSGSAYVPGLSTVVQPFAIPVMDAVDGAYYSHYSATYPQVTISGDTVSWTRTPLPDYVPGGLPNCRLVLGGF